MKLFGINFTFGGAAALAAPVLASTTQAAVAALRGHPIGAAVANDIAAAKSSTLSGPQKAAQIVANTAPAIAQLLTKAGRADAVAGAEDIARALVQQVYNETASAAAGAAASAILKTLVR